MSSSCQTGSISQQPLLLLQQALSTDSNTALAQANMLEMVQMQNYLMFVCFRSKHIRILCLFFFFSCCFRISSTCVRWWPSPHTQDVCVWATVGLNRNCWPAGGSELVEDIWVQLDRVWVWAGSTIETCRIGGLGPFGKAIVGSRPVSDTEVSGVSQLMIQERWSWANRLAGWGPTCPSSEDTTAGKHTG